MKCQRQLQSYSSALLDMNCCPDRLLQSIVFLCMQTTQHCLSVKMPFQKWVVPSGIMPSVAELEREGIPLVVAADAAGLLLSQYPFIYSSATDLRVADVTALLTDYKVRLRLDTAELPRYSAITHCVHFLESLSTVNLQMSWDV